MIGQFISAQMLPLVKTVENMSSLKFGNSPAKIRHPKIIKAKLQTLLTSLSAKYEQHTSVSFYEPAQLAKYRFSCTVYVLSKYFKLQG